jgi:hypothetical protein
MKRVLIVSPHFPPTNAPDQQRVRTSLPYFRENGWEPVILAVDAGSVAAPQEALQCSTLPPNVAVHRVSALPLGLTRLVGLGNIGYRSWHQLRDRGRALLSSSQFDLVYFSTTQFIVTGLGRRWLRDHGVPFIVDIQDPWRTDYYERPGAPRPPGGWKYRFARHQATRLEEKFWQPAAGFVAVSESYLDQMRASYRWFQHRPATVIPFGAPEADVELVRAATDLQSAVPRDPNVIQLVSVGAIGPIMGEAIEKLLDGLRQLRSEDPAFCRRLRLHFVGTSYAPADRATPSVTPIAAAKGVADLVCEQPTRVGYFTALKTMLDADGIIIPGSNDPGYRPSKLALCALADRPILALAPGDSAFARFARQLGFTFVPTEVASPPAIARHLRELGAGGFTPPASGIAALTARAGTRRQCEFFDEALAASPRVTSTIPA